MVILYTDVAYGWVDVWVCVRVSSSSENNKLGVYNDIYINIYIERIRECLLELYIGI